MNGIKKFGEPLPQMGAQVMLLMDYSRVSRCKFLEKNKMKLYYTIMLGGCLYLYANETDKKWKKVISLSQFDRIKRMDPKSGPAKDNICIELLHPSLDTPEIFRAKASETYIISTNDEKDRKEWMMSLFETLLIHNGLDKSKDDIQKLSYPELEESITNIRKREKLEEDARKRDTRYTQLPSTGIRLTDVRGSLVCTGGGYPKDGTVIWADLYLLTRSMKDTVSIAAQVTRVTYSGKVSAQDSTGSSETVDENDGYSSVYVKNEDTLTGGKSIYIKNTGVINISGAADVRNRFQMESIYANATSSSSEGESPDDEVTLQAEADYVNVSSHKLLPVKEVENNDGTYEMVTDGSIPKPNSEASTTPGTRRREQGCSSKHTKHDVRYQNTSQRCMSSTRKANSETSSTPKIQHRELDSTSRHTKNDVRHQNVPQHQMPSTRKPNSESSATPGTRHRVLASTPGHAPHDVRQQHIPERQTVLSRKEYMFSSKDPEAAKACLQEKPERTFLIQRTKDPNKMALVVRLGSGCERFNINKEGDKFYMVARNKFESLQNLVGHYQRNTFTHNRQPLRLDKGYQFYE